MGGSCAPVRVWCVCARRLAPVCACSVVERPPLFSGRPAGIPCRFAIFYGNLFPPGKCPHIMHMLPVPSKTCHTRDRFWGAFFIARGYTEARYKREMGTEIMRRILGWLFLAAALGAACLYTWRLGMTAFRGEAGPCTVTVTCPGGPAPSVYSYDLVGSGFCRTIHISYDPADPDCNYGTFRDLPPRGVPAAGKWGGAGPGFRMPGRPRSRNPAGPYLAHRPRPVGNCAICAKKMHVFL